MNKERRKTLADLAKQIRDLGNSDAANAYFAARVTMNDAAASLEGALGDLADQIESVRNDEEEYKENMPEAMQSGDKGERADEAISQIDSAFNNVEELRDALSELQGEDGPFDLDKLEQAASELDDAQGEG